MIIDKQLSDTKINIITILLFVSVGLSFFQLYLIPPILDKYISLVYISSMLLYLFFLKVLFKVSLEIKPLLLFFLFTFVSLFSLIWAVDYKFGFKIIALTLPFGAIIIVSYKLSLSNPEVTRKIVKLFFVTVAIQALMILYFRFFPEMKINFINSIFTRIFVNPNLLESIIEGEYNGFMNKGRSFGLIMSGNVGATFLGIISILSFSFASAYRVNWLKYLSALFFISLFFAGSKAADAIAILISIPYLSIVLYSKNVKLIKIVIILSTILLIILALILYTQSCTQGALISKYTHTTSTRISIWSFAYNQFISHKILGLGYGGWEEVYNMPPHNTLVYIWSQSGILGVVVALLFIFTILKFSYKLLIDKNEELKWLGRALFFSYLWLFIHGMGTNYGLFGDKHTFAIMATFLGYSYARYHAIKDKK